MLALSTGFAHFEHNGPLPRQPDDFPQAPAQREACAPGDPVYPQGVADVVRRLCR